MTRVSRLACLAVVAAVSAASCTSSPAPRAAAPAPPSPFVPVVTAPTSPVAAHRPPAVVDGQHSARSIGRVLVVWHHPVDGNPWRSFDTINQLGQKIVMPIVGAKPSSPDPRWLKVLLPERPNGLSGWIRAGDVKVLKMRNRLVIDLSADTLTWVRDGKVHRRFPVGPGRSVTPTPTGHFYVWGTVRYPNPYTAYGVYALGLSAFSPVITNWAGGGRIAIHGTPNAGDVGHPVSHGCIRVYNPDMAQLEVIPIGTPVLIHP